MAETEVTRVHGKAMYDLPKYPADFTHFEYVNPNAPKKGEIRRIAIGSYDSFNPFINKGTAATSISLLYDTLMESSADEPFSQYGLIASEIEYPSDNSWVAFYIRPEAEFHDGHTITAEDVVFTFNLLLEHGNPFYRAYYADVKQVKATSPNRVQFDFKHSENRELGLILGQLPVLPKHHWEDKQDQFNRTSLTPPLGSGPYTIKSFEPGRSIVYQRVSDHWAEKLPVRKGLHNFNAIRFDYYRDNTVALEAFKSGDYDFRLETSAKNWAIGYEGTALDDGNIIKEIISNQSPQGIQAFMFNIRRPIFSDIKVRQALSLLFDFEWTNKNLFYSAYSRSHSYFSNSELAATGLPSADELKLLTPLKEQLPAGVFSHTYVPPKTHGNGNIRPQLRQAYKLLKEAGWQLNSGTLTNKQGHPFYFELLLFQPDFERVVLPFKKNLAQLGIDLKIRSVDISQYIHRLRDYDFDMIIMSVGQSNSPGNEQREFWGSAFADHKGSRNYIGIKNEAVDTLINHIVKADTRTELVTATRALDRVLLWNHYTIPQWYLPSWRIAYWNTITYPKTNAPLYQLVLESWWAK